VIGGGSERVNKKRILNFRKMLGLEHICSKEN